MIRKWTETQLTISDYADDEISIHVRDDDKSLSIETDSIVELESNELDIFIKAITNYKQHQKLRLESDYIPLLQKLSETENGMSFHKTMWALDDTSECYIMRRKDVVDVWIDLLTKEEDLFGDEGFLLNAHDRAAKTLTIPPPRSKTIVWFERGYRLGLLKGKEDAE